MTASAAVIAGGKRSASAAARAAQRGGHHQYLAGRRLAGPSCECTKPGGEAHCESRDDGRALQKPYSPGQQRRPDQCHEMRRPQRQDNSADQAAHVAALSGSNGRPRGPHLG
jgi:hypothetical protein